MAEKVDIYKIIVEVEGAKSVDDLEKGVQKLKKELQDSEIGTKEFNDLSVAVAETEARIENSGKTAKKTGEGISSSFKTAGAGISSGFQAATGAMAVFTNGSESSIESMVKLQGLMQLKEGAKGISNSIGQMTGLNKAISSGIKGLNGLKIAFMSLGIGLVVAAIAALVAYFSRFESAMEKVEVVIAGLKGAFDAIIDTIALFGRAIAKALTGDFKGAAADAAEAVTGFNDRLKESVINATEATKALQELEDAEIAFIVTQSKLNRTIAEAREIISDENATIKEKKKALDDARKASKQLYDEQITQAKEALRIAKLETSARLELTDDERRGIAEKEAALNDLEAQRAREERTLNRDAKRVTNEQKQRDKAAIEARRERIGKEIELERERLSILEELTFEKEKEFLDRRLKAKLISEGEYQNAILKLEKDYAKKADDEKLKLAKSQSEVSEMIRQLEKEQLEEDLKANNDAFKERQLQLITQLAQGQITRKEYDDMIAAEEALTLQTEIDTKLAHGEDVTDLLIKQKENEVAINKEKNDAIIENDKAMMEARRSIAESSVEIFQNIGEVLAGEQDKQNNIAKIAALTRIGIDTAQAISALVKNSEQNPANAVTGGLAGVAQFLSGLARITKNINEARKLLGGGGVTTNGNMNGGSAPAINQQPTYVQPTGRQTPTRVNVLVKDINRGQQVVDVIDGNSFIIE